MKTAEIEGAAWTTKEMGAVMGKKPAEVFPVRDFIFEELAARGWTADILAWKMGATTEREWGINRLTLDFLFHLPFEKDLMLGEETAEALGAAFDVAPSLFLNLDKAWRESLQRGDRAEGEGVDGTQH